MTLLLNSFSFAQILNSPYKEMKNAAMCRFFALNIFDYVGF